MESGVVNNVWTKSVEIKRGPRAGKTAHVNLFSMEGDERRFSLGFGQAPLKVGDRVTFHADEEKFGEYPVEKSTITITERGVPVDPVKGNPEESAPVPKNKGSGKGRGEFPLAFDDGQRSIVRQHAITQASEVFRAHFPDEMQSEAWEPINSVGEIIELARNIEFYTSGDELREEFKDKE